MIEVRTKGVALTKPMRKDEDGFDCFTLDESKFDPFEVLLRTMAKLDYVEPVSDERHDAMIRKAAERTQREEFLNRQDKRR